MELNYHCVRDVMKFLEQQPTYVLNDTSNVEHNATSLNAICDALPKYPKNIIFYALSRLSEAGFIDLTTNWASDRLYLCYVNFITYEGHEFLEKVKDDTVWNKTLGFAGKVGNFSLEMIGKISEGVATAYFNKLLLGD